MSQQGLQLGPEMLPCWGDTHSGRQTPAPDRGKGGGGGERGRGEGEGHSFLGKCVRP